ncbi:MAG: hypothetical protein HY902_12055 [Deltaproteobacteria bacterium]|nr:hypothetical protein [Deltaproteobacteria bacterium]
MRRFALVPLALAACNASPPPHSAVTKPAAVTAASAAPLAAEPGQPSDAERIAAGQLVQRTFAARLGPVSIPSIDWVSGVLRVVVQPMAAGTRPMEVFVTRDLALLFPSAQRIGSAAAAPSPGDGGFGPCLASKGLRLYGDPGQPATQRQLAELGPAGASLLIDCGSRPAACASLGQTSLPVLQLGTQKVAAHVPRAVVAKWTGCAEGSPPAAAPAPAPAPPP